MQIFSCLLALKWLLLSKSDFSNEEWKEMHWNLKLLCRKEASSNLCLKKIELQQGEEWDRFNKFSKIGFLCLLQS